MIHFGLDPGKFVRFLLGKYTSQHWDDCCTLDAIQDHVTSDNYGHIKRILLDGCPAQLTFEEPLSNKLEYISCGNSKSFCQESSAGSKNDERRRPLQSSGSNGPASLQIISLSTSYYTKHCHKRRQEQPHCMGQIDSHLTDRYSDEPGHTSCQRSTSNVWPCQKPDLHGHLQHAHQLSNCNDSSWSSRRQGVFQIPKNPRRFNWSIQFHSRQVV
jgi:hypothetical protein